MLTIDKPSSSAPITTTTTNANLPKLKLMSIVIPCRNEEGCITSTVEHLHLELELHSVPHEIVVVDDHSTDSTWPLMQALAEKYSQVTIVKNEGLGGFGRAVASGILKSSGDAVTVMMADESDDCRDVVRYWHKLNEGYDCVFGSRFMRGGGTIDYPLPKLLLNRMANTFMSVLFGIKHNDLTNAFKAYRREALNGCMPIISPHFNLTIELPLKSITRGYTWTAIPITWRNRRTGIAKLKIQEMGSRYLFICMYVWLERTLTRDYRKL